MAEKVHSKADAEKTPHWQDWNRPQAEIVEKHCGRWMRNFNYGGEKNWLEKLN